MFTELQFVFVIVGRLVFSVNDGSLYDKNSRVFLPSEGLIVRLLED